MKTRLIISVLAVLLIVISNPCFALRDLVTVSREQAKELGMEVRATAAGPKQVQVTLEFKAEGQLKGFSDVNLTLGKGDDLALSVPLREDRSKPGLVAFNFRAGRTQLDNLTLHMFVPYRGGALGGIVYELRMKDLVQLEKIR